MSLRVFRRSWAAPITTIRGRSRAIIRAVRLGKKLLDEIRIGEFVALHDASIQVREAIFVRSGRSQRRHDLGAQRLPVTADRPPSLETEVRAAEPCISRPALFLGCVFHRLAPDKS